MNCTRCEGTGFLNLGQIPDDEQPGEDDDFHEFILMWIAAHDDHDVQVCDCCGDGEGWYDEPGQHSYRSDIPFPECH